MEPKKKTMVSSGPFMAPAQVAKTTQSPYGLGIQKRQPISVSNKAAQPNVEPSKVSSPLLPPSSQIQPTSESSKKTETEVQTQARKELERLDPENLQDMRTITKRQRISVNQDVNWLQAQKNFDEERAVNLRRDSVESQGGSSENLWYMRHPRFALSKKNAKIWKLSSKSVLTPEQAELCNILWNHIRAGTMNPVPVRIVEKTISDFNMGKTVVKNTVDYLPYFPVTVPLQAVEGITDIGAWDQTVPVKEELFQQILFPSYFKQITEWEKWFSVLQEANLGRLLSFLKGKFGKIAFPAIKIVKDPQDGIKKLAIMEPINPEAFCFLFEAGWISRVQVRDQGTFSSCPGSVQAFIKHMFLIRNDDMTDVWIKVTSAIPYFHRRQWSTIGVMMQNRPEIFPSIHVLDEEIGTPTLNHWADTIITVPIAANKDYDFIAIRESQLASIQQALVGYDQMVIWRDFGRIICRLYPVSQMQNSLLEAIQGELLLPPGYFCLRSSGSSLPKPQVAGPSPLPLISKLPDASMLLNSPTVGLTGSGSDHASRVSAAMAENVSPKAELNVGSSRSGKVARGNLVATRNVPDTGRGLLVPPQLKGRSNVVTEDIGKLFVRRDAEPSSR